jgi:uncharacterized membrane protein YjdF
MIFTRHEKVLVAANLTYIIPFTAYYILNRNFEFLWYVLVLVAFFVLLLVTRRKSGFTPTILWGLSLWGFLHMAGGGIKVGTSVLYALPLIHIADIGDTMILKYDQVVHFFGFAVATLVVHHLLKRYLSPQTNWKVVYPIIIAAGMGLGALNEIVEFAAVLAAENTGVGGYYNTALDLVFNALGALAAVVFIYFLRESKRSAS